MRINILFLFFCILCCISCTIEKRHYNKGYHIEWNSGKNSAPIPKPNTRLVASTENINSTSPDYSSDVHSSLEIIIEVDSAEKKIHYTHKHFHYPHKVKKTKESNPDDAREKNYAKSNDAASPTVNNENRVLNVNALASFIATLLSLVPVFVKDGPLLLMPFYCYLIMPLVAIILVSIAFNQFKKHPDVYKGRDFAVAALVLLSIAASILVIIGLFLAAITSGR